MKSGTQAAFRTAPFQLRGANFTMVVLKVSDPRNSNFFPQLANKIAQAPNFFKNAPVVLDFDEAESPPADFDRFCSLLRNMGLFAIGLQGGTPDLQQAARAARLALFPPSRGESVPLKPLTGSGRAAAQGTSEGRESLAADPVPMPVAEPEPEPPAEVAPPPLPARSTMMITEPVRSGRQIYAQGGDLVIVGPVSAGAELLADGSIHVYGALRGRALAGVSGDEGARIFCQALEAELVSIAGLYRIAEDIDRKMLRRQVQIYLEGGRLQIVPVAA
ncbi:MAG: septum site-determining protein MinC [Rhodospirillaceae bacterium]|nr:septum site-determining protein MinC [Rhodospirillaceae bacterium]